VPEPTIRVDVLQSLDARRNAPTQVTFDDELLDLTAKVRDLVFGQVLDPHVRRDPGLRNDVGGSGMPDAVHVRQRNLDALVARQVDSGYTRHASSPLTLGAACALDSGR